MNGDELRAKIEDLPPLPENPKRFTWEFRRVSLRNKILSDNPEEFLRWPVCTEALFVGNAPYIEKEYFTVMGQPGWQRWASAIEEIDFGNAETLPEPFDWTSGNLVHQAYHLQTWENETGKRVEDLDCIFEFGGGYGAMAMICRRLGFRGNYTILDLPEFSLLQKFFLSNALTPEQQEGLHFVKSLDWVVPKWDLLIANCSLSEVANEEQEQFTRRIRADHHLITYQPKWGEVDNHAFLTEKYPNSVKFDNPHDSNIRYCLC